MKRNLFKLIGLIVLIANTAFSQNLVWAKTMGASMNEVGRSLVTDANGNVYVTGYFQTTVDFNPGPGVLNLTSQGGYDFFIQKLDQNGNLIWAQSYGSVNHDYGYQIKLSPNGDVVVSGIYNNTVDFDFGPSTSTLTANSDDLFILRLSNTGNFKWVKGYNLHDQYATNPLNVDNLGNPSINGHVLKVVIFKS
jgi:hypothetical protein